MSETPTKIKINFFDSLMKLMVWILVFLLTQEGVDGHPDGRLGVEAEGFLLGIPETLTKG